jgi:hypothetical protein
LFLNAIELSSQLGLLVAGLCGAAALLFVVGYAVDRVATGRRSAALFAALNDSARGTPVASLPPGANGFVARVEPPPEPFSRFEVQHETVRVFNPMAWLFPSSMRRREYLFFFANLPHTPTQEIAWARHRTPPAALSPTPHRTLWTLHHLDIIDGEYATRGDNPNGVRHAFAELQRRFGPQLEQLTVYRDDAYHVRVMIRATPLVPSDVSIVVGLVRALGRAGEF